MPVQALRATLRKRTGGPDLVAAAIRQQIVDGELAAGEKLPDERTLAGTLGVARVTVRTALTLLQGEGLLERTQGRGTIVRPFLASGGPNLLTALLNQPQGRAELQAVASEFLAVRRHLAGAVLERIPVPFSAREATPLRQAVQLLEAAIAEEAELEVIVAADLLVAQALIAASQSSVLQLIFNPISSTLREHRRLAQALYQRPAENLRAWNAMLKWCHGRSRDTAGILDAMRVRDETTLKRMRAI
jgi:DNA-binding FadR family transcriptional regulator